MSSSQAQSLDQLEKERLRLLKEIEKTSELLKAHQKNKASDINRLNTLEIQLGNSDKLLKTLQKEIDILTPTEVDSNTVSSYTNEDVNSLLARSYNEKVINPKNHKENLIREIYLNALIQYTSEQPIDSTNSYYYKKVSAYKQEKLNFETLSNTIDSLSKVLKNTISNESQLEQTYSQKVSERQKLNDKIQNLLFNNFGNQTTISSSNTKSFENKKGFLKWPVSEGSIELRYGKQKIEKSNSLIFVNTGVDIVSPNNNAVSVFAGEIMTVSNISNDNITMIVKHEDNYFTVYSNLSKNMRNKGDYVTEGEVIGYLNKNSAGQFQIHFEIWQLKENLNPYHWLKNN